MLRLRSTRRRLTLPATPATFDAAPMFDAPATFDPLPEFIGPAPGTDPLPPPPVFELPGPRSAAPVTAPPPPPTFEAPTAIYQAPPPPVFESPPVFERPPVFDAPSVSSETFVAPPPQAFELAAVAPPPPPPTGAPPVATNHELEELIPDATVSLPVFDVSLLSPPPAPTPLPFGREAAAPGFPAFDPPLAFEAAPVFDTPAPPVFTPPSSPTWSMEQPTPPSSTSFAPLPPFDTAGTAPAQTMHMERSAPIDLPTRGEAGSEPQSPHIGMNPTYEQGLPGGENDLQSEAEADVVRTSSWSDAMRDATAASSNMVTSPILGREAPVGTSHDAALAAGGPSLAAPIADAAPPPPIAAFVPAPPPIAALVPAPPAPSPLPHAALPHATAAPAVPVAAPPPPPAAQVAAPVPPPVAPPLPAPPVFESSQAQPPPPPAIAPPPAAVAPTTSVPTIAAAPPPPSVGHEGPDDPHRFGPHVSALGMFSRRSGKAAILIIATQLANDEEVEVLVSGRFRGEDGAAVATRTRLILANDREWQPDVAIVALDSELSVQGWQDDKTASLVFQHAGGALTIDQIGEREMAQKLAAYVRSRAVGG